MSQFRGASFSYVVLPAGPADAEELAHVHVAAWRESYRGLLPDAFLARMSVAGHARRFRRSLTDPRLGEVTLIAMNPHGLIGYAWGGPSRSGRAGEAEIATLYVLRLAQHRGVGRRLLTETARALAAEGADSLMISVLRDNAPARAFYERLGGIAGEARPEPGPGGAIIYEVSYRWPDIRSLPPLA